MLELAEESVLLVDRAAWPESIITDSSISPFLLSGPKLAAVGRLRYELFVERDGKAYPHADHHRRLLLEPVDRVSLNFGVVKNGRCLVGVRLTKATDAHLDEQLCKLLGHYRELDHSGVVLNSRLAVAPAGQMYIPALFRQVYRAAILAGMDYGLVAARPSIAGLFERFGYVRDEAAAVDPIAGQLLSLCLDLRNTSHLRRVRSPLLRPSLEFLRDNEKEPTS